MEEAYRQGHEIVIDTQTSKVNFKISRNKTLVDERNEAYEKESLTNPNLTKTADDVLLIFVDTASKRRFHQLLPETTDYLRTI